MWNWSFKKLVLLSVIVGVVIGVSAFHTWWSAAIIGAATVTLINWIIDEINALRKVHGLELNDLEGRIEELEEKIKKK